MRPFRLFVVLKLFFFFPETRLFKLKALLLRWAGAEIGRDVNICSSVTILGHRKLTIGDHVWIGPQSLIVCSAPVHIGSNVDIAPRVYIGTGTHEIDESGPRTAGKGISEPINIEDGVWVGATSTILPGVTVKHKTVVAAGAVVHSDTPQGAIIGGVPAKIIRFLAGEGEG